MWLWTEPAGVNPPEPPTDAPKPLTVNAADCIIYEDFESAADVTGINSKLSPVVAKPEIADVGIESEGDNQYLKLDRAYTEDNAETQIVLRAVNPGYEKDKEYVLEYSFRSSNPLYLETLLWNSDWSSYDEIIKEGGPYNTGALGKNKWHHVRIEFIQPTSGTGSFKLFIDDVEVYAANASKWNGLATEWFDIAGTTKWYAAVDFDIDNVALYEKNKATTEPGGDDEPEPYTPPEPLPGVTYQIFETFQNADNAGDITNLLAYVQDSANARAEIGADGLNSYLRLHKDFGGTGAISLETKNIALEYGKEYALAYSVKRVADVTPNVVFTGAVPDGGWYFALQYWDGGNDAFCWKATSGGNSVPFVMDAWNDVVIKFIGYGEGKGFKYTFYINGEEKSTVESADGTFLPGCIYPVYMNDNSRELDVYVDNVQLYETGVVVSPEPEIVYQINEDFETAANAGSLSGISAWLEDGGANSAMEIAGDDSNKYLRLTRSADGDSKVVSLQTGGLTTEFGKEYVIEYKIKKVGDIAPNIVFTGSVAGGWLWGLQHYGDDNSARCWAATSGSSLMPFVDGTWHKLEIKFIGYGDNLGFKYTYFLDGTEICSVEKADGTFLPGGFYPVYMNTAGYNLEVHIDDVKFYENVK